VRAFVQTRGTARATDYAFLGGAPPEPWWRAYREATAFDHPTVLVISDGLRWAAYLSGIPSARVDAVGTVVRYTLVLDGPCGAPDAACVEAGVAAWLDDVAAGAQRSNGRLPAALDAGFPAPEVERWFAGPPPPPAEVHDRVLAALAALPAPAPAADQPGSWVGGVAAAAPRSAFTARVRALVRGQPGRALLLNLLGGPADAAALRNGAPVAVLLDGAAPAQVTALPADGLPGEVEAKKVPPARPAWRAGAAMVPVLGLVAVLMVLTVLVMLL
jgi:hypothetical protein